MPANTKYKDSVFSLLFGEPGKLRELYEALEGVTLPPDIPVTINTLEGVLFKARMNDISFEIGNKLVVLFEHQSTINPNMPLRLLMYIGRLYEKIAGDKHIYSGKKLYIPRPEFIVLYNGKAAYPDEEELKLSESFEDTAFLGKEGLPELELRAKVYNINLGHNEGLVRRSRTLAGYSEFIGKIRELEGDGYGWEAAMEGAVRWCIGHDILKDFLEKNSSEVMNMLMTEWNWDDAFAVQREEGREEGEEKKQREIAQNALAEGLPAEIIQKITGLDSETIRQLSLQ